jgi:hypothetical protein
MLAAQLLLVSPVHVDDFNTRALGPIPSGTERAQCRRCYMLPSRHRGPRSQRLSERSVLVPAGSNVRIQSSKHVNEIPTTIRRMAHPLPY